MNQDVLAVVAGQEITQDEFNAFLQSVPREQQAYLSNPQFKQQCLEQLIALHLFAKEGEDTKLDQTERYAASLENAKRDILAQLAMGEVMKDITVSEDEAKAYYNENKQQFSKGETISAKHILTDSEEKCIAVLESITSGDKTFEDAAKESSTCPSRERGGDLGEFGKGQMVKEFEDAAFSAEIGTVIGPVKTQFGYHLIKVEHKNEASELAFEEVKEKITVELLQKKQNAAYTDKVKALKEIYMSK
jgi:peptidyl-prolyl cis-trans isomerase C